MLEEILLPGRMMRTNGLSLFTKGSLKAATSERGVECQHQKRSLNLIYPPQQQNQYRQNQ
eukprot:8562320-Ditylum_brightwellii.AAC.1